MGRFVEASEVREVRAGHWDEGETVTIKRFSFGDRQFLMGAAMGDSARLHKGDVAVSVDIEHMNLAILERGIARWTLKRADGSVAPLNKESIASLTERDAEFILGEIQAYNPSRDEDSKNS
jgi:hypothetical protein